MQPNRREVINIDIEVLNYAISQGIIDITLINAQVKEMQKKECLCKHTNKVWQGSKGYWYTYIDGIDGKRKLIKKKELEDLEDYIVQCTKNSKPTFEECFNAWSLGKLDRGEIQPQSYDRYQTDYKRFLEEFGKKKIESINEDMLYDFILDTIHEKELTAKAWSGLRTLILGTFKYAKRKHYTNLSISEFFGDFDISRGVYKKRVFTDEESVFTDEEVKLIYKEIAKEPNNLLNLGVQLALETGLRSGEIATLEFKDLKDNVLTVSKTETRHLDENNNFIYEVRNSTKGKYDSRKVVLLPQTVALIKVIHQLNPDGKYLLEKDGKRIIAKCYSARLKRLCSHAGIRPRSMHKLRKTYVTKLANAGVPQKVICSQVGHTDFTTSNNHYWFNNQTVEQVTEMLLKSNQM